MVDGSSPSSRRSICARELFKPTPRLMQILVRLEAKDGWVMPQTRRGGGRRKPSALKHMESEDLTTLSVEVAKFWHSAYDELVRMEEQLLGQLEEMLPKLSRAARREA